MKHLLIFAKNPELGKVKTRLARAIGEEGALTVYEKLLAHTQAQAAKLTDTQRTVFYSDRIAQGDVWPESLYGKQLQRGNDLGVRMYRAFVYALLEKGASKAVIVGTDCPGLTYGRMEEAFAKLDRADAVIGPAEDGGYYLLGLKPSTLHRDLFEGKHWSTDTVLKETADTLNRLGLSHERLAPLTDIDFKRDLDRFPDFWP